MTLADELRERRASLERAYCEKRRAERASTAAQNARTAASLLVLHAEALVDEDDIRQAFDRVIAALEL